jgi:hypothetical protein
VRKAQSRRAGDQGRMVRQTLEPQAEKLQCMSENHCLQKESLNQFICMASKTVLPERLPFTAASCAAMAFLQAEAHRP